MLTTTLIALFKRDLNKLKQEIEAYQNEENIWISNETVANSAGNLCLHLVGNLNHFIGAALGNSGYVRQRDLEFSLKHVPRLELLKQVDETVLIIESTLQGLSKADLEQEYTHRVFQKPMSTEYFLVHLIMHLSYHLGQINYHRRLLDK